MQSAAHTDMHTRVQHTRVTQYALRNLVYVWSTTQRVRRSCMRLLLRMAEMEKSFMVTIFFVISRLIQRTCTLRTHRNVWRSDARGRHTRHSMNTVMDARALRYSVTCNFTWYITQGRRLQR